ncbi:hypothetical protein VXS02_09625 [Photobacterium piscicola]|uniref:hypothetical protein n=1 Tax=Photobacterium TaxID=657 RepID=UPI001F5424D7|nr:MULTISPECIES: hypothetical protein [Photobacterium]MEC6823688.1 hypothetical protein [Photobacterium piscicola]
MTSLVTSSTLAASIKTVIKLSPDPITQHTVELPLNEYHALEILALKKVSSSQVPRPYEILSTNDKVMNDINHNNIRDDYERLLLSQYQRPEYVAMGILAAAHWDRLLATLNQKDRILSITALSLITNNIAINQCYYSLQQVDNTLISPILNYFNTDQQLVIKDKAEEKLLAIIATSPFTITFEPQPCQRFTLLAESMLQTTFIPQ